MPYSKKRNKVCIFLYFSVVATGKTYYLYIIFFLFQQWATFARCWWLFDAQWQCPFQSAFVLHRHILGLHKPIYHPLSDVGDHVVVINSREIATKDHLWRTWKHFHHTGYERTIPSETVNKLSTNSYPTIVVN